MTATFEISKIQSVPNSSEDSDTATFFYMNDDVTMPFAMLYDDTRMSIFVSRMLCGVAFRCTSFFIPISDT